MHRKRGDKNMLAKFPKNDLQILRMGLIGEFEALLLARDPEQVEEMEEGKKEVEEMTK